MASKSDASTRLKSASSDLFQTLGDRALGGLGDKMSDLTDRLEGIASGNPVAKGAVDSAKSKAEGDSPVKGALKGAASAVKDKIPGLGSSSKGGGSSKATKATHIIEDIDVGVPVQVAYNLWTEFGGFPSFMKKVEDVDTEDETKLEWKAQIVWSHRTWEATILEQIPDERIVWRSKGEKGHVDGAVTFHEIGPNLTRILLVLEYYPQGLFERTGNLWRAQGRRVRVELKHFRRHVMTRSILEPDELEGWRGTIEDGEVVTSHEEALEQEESEQDEQDQSEDSYDDEPEDEADEEEAEGEEEEPEDEAEYDEPEDEAEYEEEPEEDSEEPEDEYEDEPEDEEPEAEDEYEDEPENEPEDEAEYEEEPEEDLEEPEDEYEDEPEDEEPEAEDEYEDEPEEEERPRSRRRAS